MKENGPSSAAHQKASRGRSHIAKDVTSKKALQEGVKMLTGTKSVHHLSFVLLLVEFLTHSAAFDSEIETIPKRR